MGSDAKILVRVQGSLRESATADWVVVSDDLDEGWAADLSERLGTHVVQWSIQTTVDMTWIIAFARGQKVREMLVTPDGWQQGGRKQPYENSAELDAFRRRAKRGDMILASPEGYELLEAFLGSTYDDEPSRTLLARVTGKEPTEDERAADLADQIDAAAGDGDVDAVRKLLAEPGVDPARLSLCGLRSPEVVDALLATGVDVNARKDGDGGTALIDAAQDGDAEIVALLLQRGADPTLADFDGITPLMAALLADEAECGRLLVNAGADPRDRAAAALIHAIVDDENEVSADRLRGLLVEAGAEQYGRAALVTAIEGWNTFAVRVLLEAGVDPLAAGPNGSRPVDLADEIDDEEIRDLLVKPT